LYIVGKEEEEGARTSVGDLRNTERMMMM